ncbi:hypothetical protein NDN08_004196 [Rhodosorus marinus]|uniref:Arf-GAP domain-containing protein n=1 Tax=Rhodosorus marinus TaxID=101924 RepID=A0AAV8UHJ5_9RHOD|nr:hypothetical protein NDN08_004196 [Rhodosorus marinus]
MGDKKDPKLDKQHSEILKQLLQLPENRFCADCTTQAPRWASTNLGVFLCIRCSGIHRNLGVHISTVRSTTLDTWTPREIELIKSRGNEFGKRYYEACVPRDVVRPDANDTAAVEKWIRNKYEKKVYMRREDGGLGGVMPQKVRRHPTRQRGSAHSRSAPSDRPSAYRDPPSYNDRTYDRQGPYNHRGHPSETVGPYNRTPGPQVAQFPPEPVPIVGGGMNESVQKISEMGFDPAEAAAMIARCDGNVEAAIEMLLADPAHKTHEGPTPRPSPYPAVGGRNSGSSRGRVPPQRGPPPPPSKPVAQESLIDFGFDDQPQARPTGSNAVGTASAVKEAPATGVAGDDFADFSAFESVEATQQLNPTGGAGNQAKPKTGADLLNQIASLYASTPEQASQSTQPPATQSNHGTSTDGEGQWWGANNATTVEAATNPVSATGAPKTGTQQPASVAQSAPPKDAFDDIFGGSKNLDSMFSNFNSTGKKTG